MSNNIQIQSDEVVVPLLSGIATDWPLATVAITTTAFNITNTAGSGKLMVGDSVVVSGTLAGSATITGYSSPTTYRVKNVVNTNANVDSWPAVTGAQLETTAGVAVVTGAGSTTGLTFKVGGSPQTINNARIVRIINVHASNTILATLYSADDKLIGNFTVLPNSTEMLVKKAEEKIFAAGALAASKVSFGD